MMFDYKVVSSKLASDSVLQDLLNSMSLSGWDLVSVVYAFNTFTAVFRKVKGN